MFLPRYRLILLPILIPLFGPALCGQSPQTEVIRVTSSHVLLDVRVIDRSTGQTVQGLTADDFEISEGGVRQEITASLYGLTVMSHQRFLQDLLAKSARKRQMGTDLDPFGRPRFSPSVALPPNTQLKE